MARAKNPIVELLMEQRTLLLEGEITAEKLKDLRDRILFLQDQSSEPIIMLIDSGGGDTLPSLSFCDFMEIMVRVPVHGIVTGLCGSAATFILLYCTKRTGFLHSRYLIHSSEIGGLALKTHPASREARKQLDEELDATHEQVTTMYMEKLKLDREAIEELTVRGEQLFNAEMWAAEALSLGLIQHIVDQPFHDTEEVGQK